MCPSGRDPHHRGLDRAGAQPRQRAVERAQRRRAPATAAAPADGGRGRPRRARCGARHACARAHGRGLLGVRARGDAEQHAVADALRERDGVRDPALASSAPGRASRPPAHFSIAITVPVPMAERRSNSSISRRAPGSPTPRLPLGGDAVAAARRATSAMPGPRVARRRRARRARPSRSSGSITTSPPLGVAPGVRGDLRHRGRDVLRLDDREPGGLGGAARPARIAAATSASAAIAEPRHPGVARTTTTSASSVPRAVLGEDPVGELLRVDAGRQRAREAGRDAVGGQHQRVAGVQLGRRRPDAAAASSRRRRP